MLKFYNFLSYIFIPIILINLYFRIIKNKEDKKRYLERLGKNNIKFQQSKKIIWIHASSVGEFKSSNLIIEKYHKDFNILVTTTTKTSAEYIKKYYNNKVLHQYIPYDVTLWCVRFIAYWKPYLILWIESDIWPNMLKVIRDKKINCFYINARVSPKSFYKWKYFKSLYSTTLSTFSIILAQSPNDLNRIKILSDSKVEYIGNLKLSNNQKSKIEIKNKKIFSIMIVSSHEYEEEKILNVIKNIIKNKKIKICIAPRHPKRMHEIVKILKKYNFSYSLDSEQNSFKKDITIIDGFGNLDTYFQSSEIVILGGSFVSKGGHNPIEPAKYGCALISGNFVYNWENIYQEMVQEKACILIHDVNDLENIINNLMADRSLLEEFKTKALNFSNKNFFNNQDLFNKINMILN